MQNELFASLSIKSLTALTALSILVSCAPSDPKLLYIGIDAPGAIEMIDKAENGDQKAVFLDKIEHHRRVGFDWGYFWKNVGEQGRLFRFDRGSRDRIFALSAESCSVEGFTNFAEVVLHVNDGFHFVFGDQRKCAQPLSDELFAKYIDRFRLSSPEVQKSPSVDASNELLLAQLMINQYSLVSAVNKGPLLSTLDLDEWSELVDHLLKSKKGGSSAATIVQMQQEQFGGIRNLNTLIASWLKNPIAMEEMIAENSVLNMARVLTTDPQLIYVTGGISAEKWANVYSALQRKLAAETTQMEDQPALLDELIRAADLLTILPTRAEKVPAFSDLLKWHESVLRALEAGVKKSKVAQARLAQSDSELVGLWLKLRFNKTFAQNDRYTLARMTASTPLEQALMGRLQIHASQTDFSFKHLSQNYCSFLESQGIAKRTIEGTKLQIKELSEPGCIELTGNKKPTQKISLQSDGPVAMAFDSYLTTNGWNIDLKASAFDGSFVDLSQALRAPDLPAEPTSPDFDAIAVPLAIGVQIKSPDVLSGQGTYYFAYHYTWRAAKDGLPAVAQPDQGFRGAKFTVEVANEEASFTPRWISIGGLGQKGVPQRAGGKHSQSSLDYDIFKEKFIHNGPVTEDLAQSRIPIGHPTLRILNQLFTFGATDESQNIQIFIEPKQWLEILSLEQKQKMQVICPAGAGDLDCWNQVTLQAASELWNQYVQTCPLDNIGAYVCPSALRENIFRRLSDIGYDEHEGKLGPINPDGPRGPAGIFQMKETP